MKTRRHKPLSESLKIGAPKPATPPKTDMAKQVLRTVLPTKGQPRGADATSSARVTSDRVETKIVPEEALLHAQLPEALAPPAPVAKPAAPRRRAPAVRLRPQVTPEAPRLIAEPPPRATGAEAAASAERPLSVDPSRLSQQTEPATSPSPEGVEQSDTGRMHLVWRFLSRRDSPRWVSAALIVWACLRDPQLIPVLTLVLLATALAAMRDTARPGTSPREALTRFFTSHLRPATPSGPVLQRSLPRFGLRISQILRQPVAPAAARPDPFDRLDREFRR